MTNRKMLEMVWAQNPMTVAPAVSVRDACKRMIERHVGAALVTDPKGYLLGIFTDRDAVRFLAAGRDPGTEISEVMTRDPEIISPHARAIETLRLMRDCGFRHIPVVEEGLVKGVVSRHDFCGLELDRLDEEVGVWERI